jgi:hypothetical protein
VFTAEMTEYSFKLMLYGNMSAGLHIGARHSQAIPNWCVHGASILDENRVAELASRHWSISVKKIRSPDVARVPTGRYPIASDIVTPSHGWRHDRPCPCSGNCGSSCRRVNVRDDFGRRIR